MTLNFPASPSNGDTYDNFVYDGTKGAWKLQTLAGNDLTDLNDVTITTPGEGQAILYDSSSGDWINQDIDIPAGTTISATAPESPEAGELWWDSDSGNLYIYYNDGTSSQWVSASDGQATISDTAPTGYNGQIWWNSNEGKMYVFYDDGTSSAWVAAGGPQVTVQATAPTGYEGQMWLDSTDGSMYVYYTDPGGGSSQWIGAVSRSGGILQVVQGFTTTPTSTTSSSYVDTSLTAYITPRSTSSKILIFVSVSQLITTSNAGSSSALLVRGNATSREADIANSTMFTNPTQDLRVPFTTQGYDSPNTTSTVQYSLLIASPESTSNTATVNGAQRIIIMEVAG